MPPINLNDAEHLRQVVVEPLAAALRSEMRELVRPLVEQISDLRRRDADRARAAAELEQRINSIERFKTKIAAISSAIAVVLGVGWRMALDWLKTRIFPTH